MDSAVEEAWGSSFIMSSSEDEALLQNASDTDTRLSKPQTEYILEAIAYAAAGDLSSRRNRPSLQRDVSDWMFRPDLFRALNAKQGPFTVDACADQHGRMC